MDFIEALERTLKNEGGFVDDPNDHGGTTYMGITLNTLCDFLNVPCTVEDLKNLDMETIRNIYRTYWDHLELDKVKDTHLAYLLFDQAVNRGVRRVAERIQRIVGTKVDGKIGPITLAAINAMKPYKIFSAFIKESQLSYARIVANDPTQAKFLVGWLTRTHQYMDLI